jgi:hypothetical protein
MAAVWAVALAATIVLPTVPAVAGSGFRINLPAWPHVPGAAPPPALTSPTTPQAGNPTGLVLTLDTTWVEGYGYRPVRITVIPTTPTTADRTLRVTFRPGNFRTPTVTVTRHIELPAGFTSVTSTVSLPQYENWHGTVFDVFEDGEYVKELSIAENFMGFGGGQYWGDNASPALLMLNPNINSGMILNNLGRSGQAVLSVGPSNVSPASTTHIRGNPNRVATFNHTDTIPTLGELPDRWIDYSVLDIIVASRQDLNTLVMNHPAQWEAMRRWILAGGNLWVYGVGELKQQQWNLWRAPDDNPWRHLSEINQHIAFPPADKKSPWHETTPDLDGWYAANLNAPNVNAGMYSSGPGGLPYATGGFGLDEAATDAAATKEPHFPFALRPLGLGAVAAIPDADPAVSAFPWQQLVNQLGSERWHWSTRHGVSFSNPNADFWNFLIPDVGATPVAAFQLLITLFVLIIGPLNFYFLRRWHKLNLLLITVPVSAAVVTAALLLYAVFSDGFGVRARTRSFTHLDQRAGQATCLGRTTYYAGLTPAKGLSFSGDTAVYPLTDTPLSNFDSGVTRRMAWEFQGEQNQSGIQRLESGWLQSRIQTQLLTVRSRMSDARLDIATTGDGVTSAANRLGTPVSFVVVRDEKGQYSMARDLDDGAEVELAALGDAERPAELARLFSELELSPPEGVRTGGSHSIFNIRRRYYYGQMGRMSMSAQSDSSMLERSLRETLSDASLRQLPPRSYVAIVERSPEFEIGLENAKDEDSLHVIFGRW